MSVRTTASTVTFDHVALHLPEGTLMGTVTYGRRRRLLELHDPLEGSEVLSLDMSFYGYVTAPGRPA